METSKVLGTAKKKLQYDKNLNELCAYLTPREIHALIDAGYAPIPSARIPGRNEAQPKPTWFYFLPNRGEFYE